MAAANIVQIDDIIVPSIFTPYVQQLTEEKARIVASGAVARSSFLDQALGGGGLTFNVPSFRDLDNDVDNISTDSEADIIKATFGGATHPAREDAVPFDLQTDQEIAIRLSRNAHWNVADLAEALAGADPSEAIAQRVSYYWARRLQAAVVATMSGVNKDNAAFDNGDYAFFSSPATTGYVANVSEFTAEHFLDALATMGDSQDQLAAVMVHSAVYTRMQKNNLIDFIPDARGETSIPTFLGHTVVVDDGVPSDTAAVDELGNAGVAGLHETWIFGTGALQLGVGSPRVGTEVSREPLAGGGGGNEILSSRQEWVIHPTGHAFTGSAPGNGGPTNAASTNNLNIESSWDRRRPERKQIKFARLLTYEHA